ncbi:amidohydrolase family protein [Streptomyces sp. NPDC093109]|uniref:amidohydrolase n=1 Tax=Streptomyces sp. NPDC093109 TaxID=3154977 RepID=UPI00344B604A
MNTPPAELLLRGALLPGAEAPSDVLISAGRVTAIGPAGTVRHDGAAEVRLDGRWLRPALWDEHVHFTQWVIRRGRLDLSATASAAEVLALVRSGAAPTGSRDTGVTVGYGFRDALWPDAPSLASLDAAAPARPTVLISGDLHCGWLNSAAATLLGVTVDSSGLLREAPWIEALDRLDHDTAPALATYREAARDAAGRGVVGIVDFENADNVRDWPARVAAGVTSLRVEASVWPGRLSAAIEQGYRTGVPLDEQGLVTVGRLKIVVDGSLNTRTALCWDPYPGTDPTAPHRCGVRSVAPHELGDLLGTADRAGIAVAVHAIGDRANSQVIDAFEQLGITGVIEHAQFVAARDFARFGRLGIVASVQPEHAMDDRDVADRYWHGRTDRAFAFRSLYDAGATLRLGSDAPVAPLDPWHAISAAVTRSRDDRRSWHPEQRLPRSVALAASARGRTRVAVGDPADLIVLDQDPTAIPVERLRDTVVTGTLLGGRWTWNALEG